MDNEGACSMKKEDVQCMAGLAGMEFVEHETEESFDEAFADGDLVFGPEYAKKLLSEMANAAFSTTKGDEQFFLLLVREQGPHPRCDGGKPRNR